MSSTLAFLAEEMGSSKYLRAFSSTNLASEAAGPMLALRGQFRLADLLAPLDRLVAEHERVGRGPGGVLDTRRPENARGEPERLRGAVHGLVPPAER